MLFDAEGCCMCGNYCEGSGDHVSDCTWTLLTSLIVLSDVHIQSYMIVCYRHLMLITGSGYDTGLP